MGPGRAAPTSGHAAAIIPAPRKGHHPWARPGRPAKPFRTTRYSTGWATPVRAHPGVAECVFLLAVGVASFRSPPRQSPPAAWTRCEIWTSAEWMPRACLFHSSLLPWKELNASPPQPADTLSTAWRRASMSSSSFLRGTLELVPLRPRFSKDQLREGDPPCPP